MATRKYGSLGSDTNLVQVSQSTQALTAPNIPGVVGYNAPWSLGAFCSTDAIVPSTAYPKWSVLDATIWRTIPSRLGGGEDYLFRYKDGWIAHNKANIGKAAKNAGIPIDLLAGVAWAEVGGMPDIVDSFAYAARSFDWSGPDWVDKNLTITTNPSLTSVGPLSIQLANVGKILGVDVEKLSYTQQTALISALDEDACILAVVAAHLLNLIKFDFPLAQPGNLTDEQVIVTASRYNRGIERKLIDYLNSIMAPKGSAIRTYTEYGRALMSHRDRVRALLK